jgi:hypothetical protein
LCPSFILAPRDVPLQELRDKLIFGGIPGSYPKLSDGEGWTIIRFEEFYGVGNGVRLHD